MTRDTFKAKGTPPPAAALGDALRLVAKLAAHVRPTCSELWDEAQAFLATQHQEPTMTKAAGLLPAGRNPPAPEGSVKPAPPPNPPKARDTVDVCKLVALAEQWERDAAGCRRDGYIDAAVVKEECAQRIRQTLGIGAIAEALTAAQQETIAGKFDREVLNPMRVAGRRTAPPSVPVGVKTLSEFMAEQEALHPGIHDKVQAAADELRASLAQQSAPPAAQATEVDAPGSHAWMAEVCRAAALSLAAHGVCNDQLLKVADWITQQGGEVT